MPQNQFDSIDLSDNAVIILEGFTKLPRLKTLLLSNNRVTRIGRNLEGMPHTWHSLCQLVRESSSPQCVCSLHPRLGFAQSCKQQIEEFEGAYLAFCHTDKAGLVPSSSH